MTRDEMSDVRIQSQLKRALVITLRTAISAAIECGGLEPDNARLAVREVWDSEQNIAGLPAYETPKVFR